MASRAIGCRFKSGWAGSPVPGPPLHAGFACNGVAVSPLLACWGDLGAPGAEVMQQADMVASEAASCGFDSHLPHQTLDTKDWTGGAIGRLLSSRTIVLPVRFRPCPPAFYQGRTSELAEKSSGEEDAQGAKLVWHSAASRN
jgi:hypothetical protein